MKAIAMILIAAGLTGVALAEDMPNFDSVDANKDGMISQEEATNVEGIDFAAVDANHDGLIDRDEYAKAFS